MNLDNIFGLNTTNQAPITTGGYGLQETLLKVTDVSHTYDGKKQVLDNISFEVKNVTRPGVAQSQVCSIIAESGGGKSTLFNILSNLLAPTKGTVEVFKDNKLQPVQVGDMGMVFQNYPLLEHRLIYNNLLLALEKNDKVQPKDRDATIKELTENFGISQHLKKFPKELSGGQKQRVSIAQQILNGNNFILLDEPFSGLDFKSIGKVMTLLKKVTTSNEYLTIIIVSHDLENACAISDTVFLLKKENEESPAKLTHTISLAERNLAWLDNPREHAGFNSLITEIKSYL